MKRSLVFLIALIMLLSACGCGRSEVTPAPTPAAVIQEGEAPTMAAPPAEAPLPEAPSAEEFPYVGTWTNPEQMLYLRIQEDGTIQVDTVLVSSGTSTVNGVTTTMNSRRVVSNTAQYTWYLDGDKFVFNGVKEYTPAMEDGQYLLVSDVATYHRVGDLDYQISTSTESGPAQDLRETAQEYTLGTVITGEGFELVFNECGIAQDIRITSNSSGIQITSGPSSEAGKKYVYLRGTVKNTGTKACRAVIGGTVYLDDYEFTLRTDTIGTDGAPQSSLEPFDTVHILLFAQVSDEMIGMFQEGKIVFGFNDNFDNVQVEQAKYLYYANVEK